MAETSLVVPTKCSALRKGGFVMLNGFPCKIVDMTTSKTGKHGGAKVHLTGTDIFNDRKHEELCMSTHNMDVPNVSREEYQLLDIEADGNVSYLDADGNEVKGQVKLPDDCEADKKLTVDLSAAFENGVEGDIYITVLSAMNKKAIKDWRVQK